MKAIVTVTGKDRKGIIADVCRILADNSINILDISQTVMQDFFTMIMLIDTEDCPLSFVELNEKMTVEGVKLGLEIRTQREDIFNAMHRV